MKPRSPDGAAAARRRHALALYAVALIALLAGTTPVMTGDGYEYIAMGLQMADLGGPAMGAERAAEIAARLEEMGPSFGGFDLVEGRPADTAGRFDMSHFWVYSLLAVPGVWIARLLEINANYGFALLNLTLLLIGFRVVVGRIGPVMAALLFAGPIVWYLDKAHAEVFIFALLAIAMASFDTRPAVSLVCFGLAATQASPIAGLVPVGALLALAVDRERRRDRRFWSAVGAAVALAALPPAYYQLRHGVFQLLVRDFRLPTITELVAPVFDPSIGLVGNYPMFLLALAAAVWLVARSRDWSPSDLWLSVAALLLFLPAFAQTNNFNHGAKLGLTRYALWLMPLAIPWFARARQLAAPRWEWVAKPAVAATCVWSLFAFHPGHPEAFAPGRLSAHLWTRHPAWDNPIPEIFAETVAGRDNAAYPAATATCSKVLLLGGTWPLPCPPVEPPTECAAPRALCYANRTRDGYAFAVAPRAFRYPPGAVATWPDGSAGAFDSWLVESWVDARVYEEGGADGILRATENVGQTYVYEGGSSALIYFDRPRAGAVARLAPPWRATGVFIDPIRGSRVGAIDSASLQPGQEWVVAVPRTGRALVLALTERRDD